jgi:GNAT superfamily N-acetyltransferase
MDCIAIRPLVDEEVELVTEQMNEGWPYGRPIGLHLERLAMQQLGEAIYLFAWHGPRPVGHVYLSWKMSDSDLPHVRQGPCAYLSDLFVIPEYWSGGIGTQLMEACESLALSRGYVQVALKVVDDNERALALYSRREYKDPGYERRLSRWSYLHPDGTQGVREDVHILMVKLLRGDSSVHDN